MAGDRRRVLRKAVLGAASAAWLAASTTFVASLGAVTVPRSPALLPGLRVAAAERIQQLRMGTGFARCEACRVPAAGMKGTAEVAMAPPVPLSERVFLVTGATDGIGEFTAEQLAREGCTVLIHGRNPAKVERTVSNLRRQNPNIHGFVADISLLSEVRKLAADVGKQFPVIHGFLNNAGTFAGDYSGTRKVTEEGNEYSLAVNVLAPFLLTSLLLDNVAASGAGRVLITSSMSAGSNDALNDLQCERRWSDHRAYELSKLCDAMIIMELHARYADPPRLTFHTMDPGTVNTKMLRAGWGAWGSPVRSATTSFKMLTDDRYQQTSGSGSNYCRGEGAASRARLWAELEKLTGAYYPHVD